jgi:hypothetical protein
MRGAFAKASRVTHVAGTPLCSSAAAEKAQKYELQ